MRRFHRWFGLIVAIFLALISVTGVILQVQILSEDHKEAPPAEAAVPLHPAPVDAPAVRRDPAEKEIRDPKEQSGKEGGDLHETIMHIHSGEYFGKFANLIGLVCGLALFFFSVSGMWMYWQMFKARAKNGRRDIFWK